MDNENYISEDVKALAWGRLLLFINSVTSRLMFSLTFLLLVLIISSMLLMPLDVWISDCGLFYCFTHTFVTSFSSLFPVCPPVYI